MPAALTENHANADFDTGLAVPSNGDDSADWFPNLIAAYQQICDRLQRLKLWVPPDSVEIHVPMVALAGVGTNFTQTVTSDKVFYSQGTASSTVGIYFAIPGLITGRKITGAKAYYKNANNTTQPVQTPCAVAIKKVSVTDGTSAPDDTEVGIQADTETTIADYQKIHVIELSGLTEVIAADALYYVEFAGESGTNSTTGGELWKITVTMGA